MTEQRTEQDETAGAIQGEVARGLGTKPLDFPCPICRAEPGGTCVIKGTQVTRGFPHKERGQ